MVALALNFDFQVETQFYLQPTSNLKPKIERFPKFESFQSTAMIYLEPLFESYQKFDSIRSSDLYLSGRNYLFSDHSVQLISIIPSPPPEGKILDLLKVLVLKLFP
jgi:hypothetical protein